MIIPFMLPMICVGMCVAINDTDEDITFTSNVQVTAMTIQPETYRLKESTSTHHLSPSLKSKTNFVLNTRISSSSILLFMPSRSSTVKVTPLQSSTERYVISPQKTITYLPNTVNITRLPSRMSEHLMSKGSSSVLNMLTSTMLLTSLLTFGSSFVTYIPVQASTRGVFSENSVNLLDQNTTHAVKLANATKIYSRNITQTVYLNSSSKMVYSTVYADTQTLVIGNQSSTVSVRFLSEKNAISSSEIMHASLYIRTTSKKLSCSSLSFKSSSTQDERRSSKVSWPVPSSSNYVTVPNIKKGHSSSTARKVGIGIGVGIGLLLITFVVWLIKRRQQVNRRYRMYDNSFEIPGFTEYGGTVQFCEMVESDQDVPGTLQRENPLYELEPEKEDFSQKIGYGKLPVYTV